VINAVLDIKLLAPEEWHVLRSTRLRALLDSPHAFLSGHDAEVGWSEARWRRLLAEATWVVASESGMVIGIAGLFEGSPCDGRHIESIWVAPTHRHRGVFRALLQTLVDRQRSYGARSLALWVLETNIEARQAYKRLGFELTGERQPLPGPGDRYELRLRLAIPPRRG
jgi:ribosomal protein S18 acetylase RimI-like enzyme